MPTVDPAARRTDDVIRVFVSYSRKDRAYLADDSLLGFLKGLSAEAGVEFWTDERISAGSFWNDEIRTRLEHSDIALVLVSQAFLDSPFCTQVEIESFLDSCRERGLLIFPIVLSPCEWEQHEWLATRQFLPGGTETIEEHYTEPGKQKRIFLRIRKELRQAVESVRQARGVAAAPVLTPEPAFSAERRQVTFLRGEPGAPPRRKWLLAVMAIAVMTLVAVVTWIAERRFASAPESNAASRLDIALPPELSLFAGWEMDPFAISPNGRNLAFVAARAGVVASLYVRRLDSVDVRQVEGSDGASSPFWSSDGKWLGFSARGKLWKTRVLAGARPEPICDVFAEGAMASWVGGTILFADRPGGRRSIFRISSSGGQAIEVMRPNAAETEWRCSWPQLLPDGRHFLYVSFLTNSPERRLMIGALDSAQRSALVRGASQGRVVGNDWIVYVREGKLLAQRIDVSKGVTIQDSSAIAENVAWLATTAAAHFDVSSNGTVVYESNTTSGRLVVADRRGTERVIDENSLFYELAISPDGKRAVVSIFARETGLADLWIYELSHGIRQRFTTEPGTETSPFWSPDGRTIVYSSAQGGLPRLARRELSASSSQYVLPESESGYQFGGSFSPDGKNIYYSHRDPRNHIYSVPLSAATRPQLVLGTDSEDDPRVSPDGKWLAFTTGDFDIHVLNLVSGEQIPLTKDGHAWPRWRRDGRELFCLSRQGVVSVTPGTNGDWHVARETTLFELKDRVEGFDVAPDGQSFLLSEWTRGPTDRLIHVVTGAITP